MPSHQPTVLVLALVPAPPTCFLPGYLLLQSGEFCMCMGMLVSERSALVAVLCRNFALLRRSDAQGTRVAAVLASYREVADATGCRPAFQEALRALDEGRVP